MREPLAAAADRLRRSERSVALANAGRDAGRAADLAMSQTAQAAIFTEALLAAQRARFQEIKAVTK